MKSQKAIRKSAETALRTSIREAAKANGFGAQIDLAKLLDVTPQYVSDMMSGRRKWGADRLKLLGSRLGLRREAVVAWHRLGAAADGWLLL